MTKDIQNYSFYFEPEAEALLTGLGEDGRRILILETDVTPYAHEGQPQIDFGCSVGDAQLMQKHLPKARERIRYTLQGRQGRGSFCAAVPPRLFGKAWFYIAFNDKTQFAGQLGEMNRDLMNLFVLYHEAGHVFAARSFLFDHRQAHKEGVADAFAALSLLQRFGIGATPFLSQISWLRTNNALTAGDIDHLSTTVLDKIILDSAQRDFSSLSRAETVKLAKRYARDFMPGARTLARAEKIFKRLRIDMPDIANVIRSSAVRFSVDDFTFSLLAKEASVFAPGELVYDGKDWKPQNAKYHEEMQADVAARLSTLRLRDVFNDKALAPAQKEAPLADALKVTLFPWQKQFVYQPKKFEHRA